MDILFLRNCTGENEEEKKEDYPEVKGFTCSQSHMRRRDLMIIFCVSRVNLINFALSQVTSNF